MPKHITYQITEEDSVSFFYSDPIVAGIAHRDDFNALSKEDEVRNPGIYILISPAQRYVGQASANILTRLNEHHKNKPWWEEVIFISHQWGGLGKDKLDYLESKLISEFKALGYDMDNSNGGNTSHISRGAKIEADNFLQHGIEAVEQIGRVKFYPKPSKRKVSTDDLRTCYGMFLEGANGRGSDGQQSSEPDASEQYPPIPRGVIPTDPDVVSEDVIGGAGELLFAAKQQEDAPNKQVKVYRQPYKVAIYDSTGVVAEGAVAKDVCVEYLREYMLATSNGYEILCELSKENSRFFYRGAEPESKQHYRHIDRDLWLYTTVSRDSRIKFLKNLGKSLNREITLEEWIRGVQDTGLMEGPFINPTGNDIKAFFDAVDAE